MMDTRPLKRVTCNHSENLEVLLKGLRNLNDLGGSRLKNLVFKYGVRPRRIYQYLNELNSLGYEVLNNINQDPKTLSSSSISAVKGEQSTDLLYINKSNELENLKHEIHSTRLFIMEVIRRLRMNKSRRALTGPFFDYTQEDAITASRHSLVLSDSIN